jgi:threonine synthase
VQEAQMTTVQDPNVFNLAVEGTFDDCQVRTNCSLSHETLTDPFEKDIVKALFGDKEFNAKYRLGAVNSINWARILAQIVYYFSSYFTLVRALRVPSDESPKVQFAVPTGNFGDVLAGWYAKRLGLPVEKLVVATNENDILARFWKTGRYVKADSDDAAAAWASQLDKINGTVENHDGGVKATLSPAMDILVSSNFERLLWYLAFECKTTGAIINEDKGEVDGGLAARIRKAGEVVNGWMFDLKTEGSFEVGPQVLEAAGRDFVAERVTDEEVGFVRFPPPAEHCLM